MINILDHYGIEYSHHAVTMLTYIVLTYIAFWWLVSMRGVWMWMRDVWEDELK